MATSVKASLALLVLSIVVECLFPTIGGLHVTYVAAPLVMLFYNGSLSTCLWAALACGLALDAIELSPRLGFLGLSYLLSCRILYPVRLYFFKDSNITLPVMTFFFSFLVRCTEIFVALFFDISVPKTPFATHLGHLLLLPLADAFMSLVIFMLPTFIWHQYRVRMSRRRYSDDS